MPLQFVLVIPELLMGLQRQHLLHKHHLQLGSVVLLTTAQQ
jgi:hypothetical protein